MVIQRLQTLFLLIAVVAMAVFCLTPMASMTSAESAESFTPVFVRDLPVFLILNIVIALMLFLGIFLFKNLRRQISVTLASIVLICVSIVTFGIVMYVGMPDAKVIWTGGVLLLVLALIMAVFAYRYMKKDLRTLTSYDRLR